MFHYRTDQLFQSSFKFTINTISDHRKKAGITTVCCAHFPLLVCVHFPTCLGSHPFLGQLQNKAGSILF